MKRLKQTYESPLMWRTLVELEDGFCAGSATVQNPDNEDYGRINSHDVNVEFGSVDGFKDGVADFSKETWK